MRRLDAIGTGRLRLCDGSSTWDFGSGTGGDPAESPPLEAEIRVHDERFYTTMALRGTLGAAEAYLDGWWSSDDLVGLFRLLSRNAGVRHGLDSRLARGLRGLSVRAAHLARRNTVRGSRRNIAAHYDLGEDFYGLFLDDTLTYSSGMFPHPGASLEEASRRKYERICRKLALRPGDHVLEIGSGWGGFALHAARYHGCRVTTTTISRRQFDHARQRIGEAGLEGRVTLLLEDYRKLAGVYDHVVSIEMIEAVGAEYLELYFERCARLLRAGGLMLLQAITLPDHRFDVYRRSVDFIQRFVFPGGCLPSISAIARAVGRSTDFRFLHLEDFAGHYARTLARWRGRFVQNLEHVRTLGFDERFLRLWHYYLAYCEAGFLENQIGVAQILLARPQAYACPLDWSGDDRSAPGPEAAR